MDVKLFPSPKGRTLKACENRGLRIFGPKREVVAGIWRKLHNEKLHNLYLHQILLRK
jgi:hypothetical protein